MPRMVHPCLPRVTCRGLVNAALSSIALPFVKLSVVSQALFIRCQTAVSTRGKWRRIWIVLPLQTPSYLHPGVLRPTHVPRAAPPNLHRFLPPRVTHLLPVQAIAVAILLLIRIRSSKQRLAPTGVTYRFDYFPRLRRALPTLHRPVPSRLTTRVSRD